MTESRRRNNDAIDVAKFLLSFFVVAIHAKPFTGAYEGIIHPYVRVAVPLFFMFSAYLFFGRLRRTEESTGTALKRFAARNMKLYGAWFVVLFCVAGYVAEVSPFRLMGTPLQLLRNVVLGSTFGGSWFLSALVVGMVVVCLLSRFMSNGVMAALGAVLYALGCAESNYMNLMEGTVIDALMGYYPVWICNSFPVAILWIVLGKMMAERDKPVFPDMKTRLIALAVSLGVLIAENALVVRMGWTTLSDAYLTIAPVCVALFDIVIHAEVRCRHAKLLRELSIVTYCINSTVVVILGRRNCMGMAQFFWTSVICLAVGFVLRWVSRIPGLKWLRCMY